MSVRVHEAGRQVVCPECGETRWIAARHARDVERGRTRGICKRCARGGSGDAPPEGGRLMRWWLDRFDDATLAEFAAALGVEDASIANVAATRAHLGTRRPP